MHNTRREFLDDFLSFVGELADTNARSVAARLLNQAITRIWLQHPFREYRSPVPLQLALVVNQARYSLPDYVGRIGPGQVRNATQGGRRLTQMRQGSLETEHPELGTTLERSGSPSQWDFAGVSGVHTQPAVAGDALEVLSSDAADTDVVVAIAGDDSTGRWNRNQVTLNGVNPVAIGTWSFVDEFGKSYVATVTPVTDLTSSRGTITLRKAAGAAELQKLFTQESAHEHPIFLVYQKPSAADTLLLPVIRKPKRLLRDADPIAPMWDPAIWEEMLIQWMVNTGDMPLAQSLQAPRPALRDLVAFDNEQKGPSSTTPFGGM